ncbi:MAG: Ig-like domain-containing protein [Patescibacteria group bacterium]
MTGRNKIFQGILAGLFLSSLILAGSYFVLPETSLAGSIDMTVGGSLGYGPSDLLQTVVLIVRWALGLLALVAVIFIIYGGYLWLSSRGNEEQVMKAKRVLRDAVIGIVIVLLAWAIVTYIIGVVGNATNGEGGSSGCGLPDQCVHCDTWCNADGSTSYDPDNCHYLCNLPSSGFKVRWTQPRNDDENVTICTVIQAGFNETVNSSAASVNTGTFSIYPTGSPADIIDGTFTIVDKVIDFMPTDFLAINTAYTFKIEGVLNLDGEEVDPKTVYFTTGEEVDEIPPIVNLTDPIHDQGEVCTNTNIAAVFNEPIRVITVHDGAEDPEPSVRFFKNYDTAAELELPYRDNIHFPDASSFIAKPLDLPLDSFTDYSAYLVGGEISNAITDVCGNQLDGGGGPHFGGVPNGTVDPPDTDRYVWDFETGDNPECTPEITGISPTEGYYTETNVTIDGYYLGITGDVVFKNRVYDKQNCFDGEHYPTEDCVTQWFSTQIKIDTPVGSEDNGNIKVDNGFETATSEQTYQVLSPFINWISPKRGGVGQYVTIKGENFGDIKGNVWFRRPSDRAEVLGIFPPEAQCGVTWWNDKIIITVPPGFNVDDDLVIQVETAPVDPKWSNQKDFKFTDDPPGPGLCLVEPDCGSAGEEVSLYGEKFGDYEDGVTVVNYDEYQAAGYPGAGWSDQHIRAQSQASLANDGYTLRVFNAAGNSNPMPYDIPCGGAPYIINDTSCDPDLDLWPSPNPRPNSTDVCKNAVVNARFGPENQCIGGADEGETCTVDADCDSNQCGMEMNGGTLAGNVILEVCNAGGSFDATACADLGGTLTFYAPNQFTLDPAAAFVADTWYQATVNKEVESSTGAKMNSDYSWHFKIKEDGSDCPVAFVNLYDDGPDPVGEINYIIAAEGDNFEDYHAAPFAEDCTPLAAGGYTYLWSSFNTGVAQVAATTVPANKATAVANGYTYVKVETEGKSDRERLTVNYCDASTDCTDYDGDGFGDDCPDSVCDLETNKCTPDVLGLSPGDGAPGTCVTIPGCYFGESTGTVKYTDDVTATSIRCQDDNWQDHQIVSEVPEGASNGLVTIRKRDGLEADSAPQEFTVNATVRPCLCRIAPSNGEEHDKPEFYGYGFTSAAGDQLAYYTSAAGGFIEAATYGSWTDTRASNVEVPVGVAEGDNPAKVTIDGLDSNELDFGFDPGWGPPCSSDPDPAICTPDDAMCPVDSECRDTYCTCRSLPSLACDSQIAVAGCQEDDTLCPVDHYCDAADCLCKEGSGPEGEEGDPCDSDDSTPECDPEDALCNHVDLVCNPGNCECRWKPFEMLPFLMDEGCTSSLVVFEFNQRVDAATATVKDADDEYINIRIADLLTAEYVPGQLSVYGKKVIFNPDGLFKEDGRYQYAIQAGPGGVLSEHGGELEATYQGAFDIEGPCTLSKIKFFMSDEQEDNYGPPDLFTCNYDSGCGDDFDDAATGNQHALLGLGYDNVGRVVSADFTSFDRYAGSDDVVVWNDPSPVAPPPSTNPFWYGYIEPKSGTDIGTAQIDVEATDEPWTPVGEEPNVVNTAFSVKVFICEHPWPTDTFPFRDPAHNWETFYCMDGGLPDFTNRTSVVPPDPDILGEYLLTKAEGADVIGIRMMKNFEHYSPSEWYAKKFGPNTGHPMSLSIDGYQAVKDGRTIYINGANLGGTLYSNMYIISYDEEESSCNIAKNPSFESGLDDWSSQGGTVTIDSGVGAQIDDSSSVKLYSPNGIQSFVMQEFDNLEIGKSYTISGWVKAEFAASNKGRVGIITQCYGLRCDDGSNVGKKCKINDDCPDSSCGMGIVNDTQCGFHKSSYPLWGDADDIILVNDEENGGHGSVLPWTKVNVTVKYDSPGYTLRVLCVNSTTEADTGIAGGSGEGNSWCDFIQLEPRGSCNQSFVRQVYDELIDNWAFNTNEGSFAEGALGVARVKRDIGRLGDLMYVRNRLIDYAVINNSYPDLEAGSYMRNISSSLWPSWQARLGNALGKGLPSDPLQTTAICAPPYDTDTCWDEEAKIFTCPGNVYSYGYRAFDIEASGALRSKLYGHLEYTAAGWQDPVSNYSGDLCQDRQCSDVSCFNKEINVGDITL